MEEKNKMRKKRNLIIGIIVVLVLLIIIYFNIRAQEKMFSPEELGLGEEGGLKKANEKFIKGDFMDPGVYEEFFVQTSAEQIINSCKNGGIALDFFSCLRMATIYKDNANEIEQICNEISEEACEIYYIDYSDSYKQRCLNNVPIIKESCKAQLPFYY